MNQTLEMGNRYYIYELENIGYELDSYYRTFIREIGDLKEGVQVLIIQCGHETLCEVTDICTFYKDEVIHLNGEHLYIGQEIHLYDITDGTETEQIIQNKSVTWENIIPSCNNVTIFFNILTPDLPYESMMVKITDICIDLY